MKNMIYDGETREFVYKISVQKNQIERKIDGAFWLRDLIIKEAVHNKIYNKIVEKSCKESGLSKMEEYIVKGFINKFCS